MSDGALPRHAAVVIVGGGVMGASLAYHLACHGRTDVLESVDLEWEQVNLAAAVRRLPLLERAGLAHHWAGLYEMTPDAHPLIGRLDPLTNAYVVGGFSGHGFMHGPIAGKLLAELILDGRTSTLDITPLRPDRFSGGGSAREYNVI